MGWYNGKNDPIAEYRKDRDGEADETVVRFSRYLRTNINILQSDELVTFQEELEYLEDYIALEQIRFGDRIRFEKEIGLDDFLLPPLLLQPTAVEEMTSGEWPLSLFTCTIGGKLRVTVRCDLIGEEENLNSPA